MIYRILRRQSRLLLEGDRNDLSALAAGETGTG